jgi:hypothetical protein
MKPSCGKRFVGSGAACHEPGTIARTLPDWIWTNGEGVAESTGRIEKAGRVVPGGVDGRRVQAVSTAATQGNKTRARTILPLAEVYARPRTFATGRA